MIETSFWKKKTQFLSFLLGKQEKLEKMSLESKSNYVTMDAGKGESTSNVPHDPSKSQEENDYLLAARLQQQENERAKKNNDARSKKKEKISVLATGRSSTQTKLASIRDKDGGAMKKPDYFEQGDYAAPDAKESIALSPDVKQAIALAEETFGVIGAVEKATVAQKGEAKSQYLSTARSSCHN